jgi:hypothetical protein
MTDSKLFKKKKIKTVPFNNIKVPIGLEDSYMGYGAVVPDGYGVSYNLQVKIFLTKNITFLWRFSVFSVISNILQKICNVGSH